MPEQSPYPRFLSEQCDALSKGTRNVPSVNVRSAFAQMARLFSEGRRHFGVVCADDEHRSLLEIKLLKASLLARAKAEEILLRPDLVVVPRARDQKSQQAVMERELGWKGEEEGLVQGVVGEYYSMERDLNRPFCISNMDFLSFGGSCRDFPDDLDKISLLLAHDASAMLTPFRVGLLRSFRTSDGPICVGFSKVDKGSYSGLLSMKEAWDEVVRVD